MAGAAGEELRIGTTSLKPQALAALFERSSSAGVKVLTLPPALPANMTAPPPPPGEPPWMRKYKPSSSSLPVKVRLSPLPPNLPPLPGVSQQKSAPASLPPMQQLAPVGGPGAGPRLQAGPTLQAGSAPQAGQAPLYAAQPGYSTPVAATSADGGAAAAASAEGSASLRVFVGTWNMHGKEPPATLVPWLPAKVDTHDMYVIGTQEAERSIQQSLLISSKAKWEAALRAHLGDGFVLLSARTLAAIHLAVFVRVGLLGQLGDVESAAVPTGFANALGNKGGVGVSCTLGEASSLLFVNCHLAAHQEAIAERNADFHRIDTQMPLQPRRGGANGGGANGGGGGGGGRGGSMSSARGYDAVVWLGDFNYRCDFDRAAADALLAPPDEQTRAAPTWRGEEAHWEAVRTELLAKDQLRRQMRDGAAFAHFSEGAISFRPTYKFDKHAPTEYDHSEKQRVPAYTDRVLYRGTAVELLRYGSCEEVLTSDHRPVAAEFRLSYQPRPDAPVRPAAPLQKGQTSSVCTVM